MHYVYLLKSIPFPTMTYVGYTINLKQRLDDHNCGESVHTSKYRPWRIEMYICFQQKEKALNFEKYLKSSSGRAFAQKRFW